MKNNITWNKLKKEWKRDWMLYAMSLFPVIYILINNYYPMYGIIIAFKKFNVKKGILGSPWCGFDNFEKFIDSYYFENMITNTLRISIYGLLVGFTLPIIFALFLNHLRSKKLKKSIQMISYAPHFLSTVVICSMITLFCRDDSGVFNIFRVALGMDSVNLLSVADWFDDIYVWTGVWQGMGWSAIIYIAALSGVDPELHEAAIIDGASKMQRIRFVDLPSIKPTIVMLLILQFGSIMSIGFEKVYLLQNSLNYAKSVILSTYSYEVGLIDGDYGFSTAVSFFNTCINVTLLLGANFFSKKVLDESLF